MRPETSMPISASASTTASLQLGRRLASRPSRASPPRAVVERLQRSAERPRVLDADEETPSSAERVPQLTHRVGHEPVVRPRPAAARLDEPGVAQHLQVMGDRRLREVERRVEVADAALLGRGEPVDDRDARRVGQRAGSERRATRSPRRRAAPCRARSRGQATSSSIDLNIASSTSIDERRTR